VEIPHFETIHAYPGHWAGVVPDRDALAGGGERLTYADVVREMRLRAVGLLDLGVGPGDRVAVLAPPSPDFFVSFLAIVSIGAIYLGLNPKMTDEEVGYQLDDARPRALVHHPAPGLDRRATTLVAGRDLVAVSGPDLAGRGRAAAPRRRDRYPDVTAAVRGEDAAAIVYTSGTTGRPKGALLPHRGFAFTYAIQNRRWLAGEAERVPVVEPINHVAAVGDETFAAIAAGGTAILLEQFDAEELLALIDHERITFWYTDPAILGLCTRSPAWSRTSFASLRRVVWSGGRAPLPLVRELRRLGVPLGTSWGMTETVGSVVYTDDDADDELLSATLGRPDPAYRVKVVRDDGGEAGPGETGELCVQGPYLMLGYFERPEATRQAVDGDGWLHTADLVRVRDDGNLELVGRLSDMFKSGGENIYPREVEQVLEAHASVAAAVVVPRPDDLWGEVGHAYVVAGAPVTADALRDHARAQLARYKVPKSMEFVPGLPILPSGKVDRRALAARARTTTTQERSR
jgi:acyl-CoA synthetase (AMP-forming)/AMP-acid ligase II